MAKRGRQRKIDKEPNLQATIVGYIEQGLTDEMACSQAGLHKDTFYKYIREIPDFSDAITRAREKAHILAVIAFRTGLTKHQTNEVTTDEFTETRTRIVDGKLVPYEYTKRTKTVKLIEHAPDWRAGEAWLKRRDNAHWSDKLSVEIDTRKLEALLALLKQRNISASELFDNLIGELANAQESEADHE